jgi:FkbM family methyltransferase
MKAVLHIGAAEGEIEFYSNLGVDKLVYAEPDKGCLQSLSMNIKESINKGNRMEISVVPKACSARSGEQLNFYANSSGQSSLEKPESRVIDLVGDNFQQYVVETISLTDLKNSTFGSRKIDYCCIDTQGHEKAILCAVNPQYLRSNFMVIDVELMTDVGQYSVSPNNWKEVVMHLIRSGFEPLIHPHGITESYIFINSSLNLSYFTSAISAIRDRLMKNLFAEHGLDVDGEKTCIYASLGDHMFLPFTHIGGTIHASLLQPFREEFVANYLSSSIPMLIA